MVMEVVHIAAPMQLIADMCCHSVAGTQKMESVNTHQYKNSTLIPVSSVFGCLDE